MSKKVLMKGNEAIAEAAVRAGCKLYFGYPITPQSEIPEYMSRRLPKIEGGAYIQAETEVSAINMVYGAASTGKRAMTSSSSPGVSLMMEGISYLAGAELPCLLVNIMRGGPGLGNINPEQADYFQAVKGGGHGSYHLIVLAPSSVQEMADLTVEGFNLADKYRNPVMVVAEGNLGQMMEPVEFKESYPQTVDHSAWALTGAKGRPGHVVTSIYLAAEDMEKYIQKLYRKYDLIEKTEVRYEEFMMDDAEVVLVAYGIVSRVVRNVVEALREEKIKAGMIRPITLWPYPKDIIRKRADQAKFFLTCEMSTGQMVEDVLLSVNGKKPVYFYGRFGGMVPTPAEIVAEVKKYYK
ncbi:MAG: 3-methyl-2-oxobutanoate dehydrogenase subunit VorB [Candidatus Wallbacteria bacterium]|nr:3-methyl-2-oxobutanoate dehydrogenase subunit VorB [Candidatus Wallbacteria bacterium]